MTPQELGCFSHMIFKNEKIPKIITGALFLGLVSIPVSGFAESKSDLPQDPNLVSGTANFNINGNTLTIEQNTDKLITNWSSFNIGKENKVEFKQPNLTSTALNRVNSNDPTHIYGSLKSNGKIILINPNGVLFKEGSRVDVGSIIASTLNLKDKDFINDKYAFEKNGLSGEIKNQGDIQAIEGGTVAIIAPQVENKGKIETPNGAVALISGEKVKLSLNGNSLIQYSIERGVLNSLIENKEAVKVDNGTIILSAKGVREVKSAVVKNSGSLRAEGITKKGGKIYLSASNGKVLNSGTIAANSQQNKGGSVRVTAKNIEINETSRISATGKKSGGLIEIGGSWQNSNKNVFQATKTTISEGARLDASASDFGDGGEIVVWSNIHDPNSKTTVKGSLKAEGGKGGRVETSGHDLDIENIEVSTKSNVGKDGLWLIDPYNIIIDNGSNSNVTGTYNANGDDAFIDVNDLETQLSSNNITIFTGNSGGGGLQSGDITVNSSISSSSSNDLTLDSANNIVLNANITRSGTGGLILNAGSNSVSGSGTINLASGSSISAETGVTVSNNINLTSSGDVNFGGTGSSTYSGSISGSGNVKKVDNGTINFSGSNSYTGQTIISAGTLQVSGTLADTTDVSVSSGAIYDVDASDTIQSLSGAGNIELSNGITLTTGDSGNDTISGVISGAGNFTKTGSGTLTLAGNNTYTGTSAITAGEITVKGTLGNTNASLASGSTLSFDGGDDTIGSIAGSGLINIPSGITITSNASSGSTTFSGDLSGDGNFVKDGDYSLTLSGTNSITGTKTINAGILSVSSDNNLGSVPGSAQSNHLNFGGGTLQTTANFTINSNRGINLSGNGTINTNSSTQLNYGGQIQGSGNLTKSGSGTLLLSGSNTLSGTTTITGGVLSVSSSDNLGPNPGSLDADNIILDGGTLSASTSFTLGNNKGITLNSASTIHVDTSSTLTYAGTISGSRGYFKTGSGTLLLSGTNTYTGTTNIDAGTVQVTGTLSSSTTVDNEGIFDLDSTNTVASIFGSGDVQLASGITLTTGNTSNRTISGVISGAANLVKVGSGRLTLSGTNTLTGSIEIQAGTLGISTDRNLGAVPGSVVADSIILNGGTLKSTGTTTLDSNRGVTMNASSAIEVDGSTTELTISGIVAGGAGKKISKTGAGKLIMEVLILTLDQLQLMQVF